MESALKFLVIGLGSMGKRRIRNLQAIGGHEIAGFDVRADRRREAHEKYSVPTFTSYDAAIAGFSPEAIIVSTDPKHHLLYATSAAEIGVHCFIEASVLEPDAILELGLRIKPTDLVFAPSCTMKYFPVPRKILELVRAGSIGRSIAFNYQVGQYLPDWHPWESIHDYYVSRPETGGCREILPFELTWLNNVFGFPTPLACLRRKLTDIPADIDDIYTCLLDYPGGVVGNITIEVISRPTATRQFLLLGSEGKLAFNSDSNCVQYLKVGNKQWTSFPVAEMTIEQGYIHPEEPYIAELKDFIRAIDEGNRTIFPNTLDNDARVLKLMGALEELSRDTR
jgi:predicted dehydrogenase